jgi:hypothetical protein
MWRIVAGLLCSHGRMMQDTSTISGGGLDASNYLLQKSFIMNIPNGSKI